MDNKHFYSTDGVCPRFLDIFIF